MSQHVVFQIAVDAAFGHSRPPATAASQLTDLRALPTNARQVELPPLDELFLEEFNRQWLGPGLEDGLERRVLEHGLVGPEVDAVVRDVVPGVVHVDVEL